MTFIQPLHSNLIVEDFALGQISNGGLLIPEIARASTPYRYAKVIAVGPGRYAVDGTLVPVTVKVGEVVAVSKGAGVEFPLDDADGNEKVYRCVAEQYLLGIVRDMPEQSMLTGIDGRLLRMQPVSRAPSDGTVEHWDRIERATKQGFIDSSGNTLEAMADADRAEAES